MEHHDIRITNTGETGCNSGRPRYRVECLKCGVLIHSSTTAPQIRVEEHLGGIKGYESPLPGILGKTEDIAGSNPIFGPPNTFQTDEGGLEVSIGTSTDKEGLALQFSKSTSWISMGTSEAIGLGRALLASAQTLQKDNRFHRKALKVPTDAEKRIQIVRWTLDHPLWSHPQVVKVAPRNIPIDQFLVSMKPGPDWKTKVIDAGSYLDCIQTEFVYVDPETETIEDDPARNTSFRVWIEAGGWVDNSTNPNHPPPPEGWTEYNKWIPEHDPNLDCGGVDMESALVELGLRLKFFYKDNGADRKYPQECGGHLVDENDEDSYVSNCHDAGDGYCIVCGYAIEKDDE